MAPKRKAPPGEVPLYFAFPDGVFHHVCAECNALCCRGHGFGGSLKREMGFLLKKYPALESMAVSRCGDVIHLITPPEGCYFLDGDARCRIEKEHGKARKPEVCTLFPFNVLHRLGDFVTVSPHFMCPLRLMLPARPRQAEGSHERLREAIQKSAFVEGAYLTTQLTKLPLRRGQNARETLAEETSFRDACALALSRKLAFRKVLAKQSSAPKALELFLARALGVLGIEAPSLPSAQDAIDQVLLAMAPSLRLGMLPLSPEARLRALALAEVIVRRAELLSSEAITLRRAHQLISAVGPALRLLAHGEEPLTLSGRAKERVPPFGEPQLTFAAFLALRGMGGEGGVLGALEKALPISLSASDRSVLLVTLGGHLEKRATGNRQ